MSMSVILLCLLCQFVIQLALYKSIKKVYDNTLGRFLSKKIKEDKQEKVQEAMFICLNFAISWLVACFTAAGAIAGITNLAASVLLGVVMYYDIQKPHFLAFLAK